MGWDRPKTVAALLLLALSSLVGVVTRLDGDGRATKTDCERESCVHVVACKDKAGNYIQCPPEVLERHRP
jgi:hypothetical protein